MQRLISCSCKRRRADRASRDARPRQPRLHSRCCPPRCSFSTEARRAGFDGQVLSSAPYGSRSSLCLGTCTGSRAVWVSGVLAPHRSGGAYGSCAAVTGRWHPRRAPRHRLHVGPHQPIHCGRGDAACPCHVRSLSRPSNCDWRGGLLRLVSGCGRDRWHRLHRVARRIPPAPTHRPLRPRQGDSAPGCAAGERASSD
jgi:hypothetical protein